MTALSIPQAIEAALQHHQSGRLHEAENLYRQVLAAAPDQPDALHFLGLLAHQVGNNGAAMELMRRAIAVNPSVPHYHSNLANVLRASGRLDEAIECCRRAIALQPDYAEAYTNLGIALQEQGRSEEAIEQYRKSLSLRPGFAATHNNLGVALQSAKRLSEADSAYAQAVALAPDYAEAYSNLASLRMLQGRGVESIEMCRKAVSLRPGDAMLHSGLIYNLEFDPNIDMAGLRREREIWSQRHAHPLFAQIRPHPNDRNPGRPLRVGYSSPALRAHVVGWMLEALLKHHDRRQFHITCYSDTRNRDAVTQRLMGYCDVWRETMALSDAQFAEQVRQDRIDILVDLHVHMSHNRLLAFARKPAPVQVTYLGYNSSTGLETIAYRLTDAYMSPPECAMDGPEKLVRLPGCYWCYTDPRDAPPVNELPALKHGRISFASFNHVAKIHDGVIEVWSELLKTIPRSELHLVMNGAPTQGQIHNAFAQHGISPERLKVMDFQDPAGYFQLYQQADIALDPFPYNGGVTTIDSLWMGVPVVSLAGKRAVSRAGLTILSNVELAELVANSPEQYVKIATDLANDLPRLAELRRGLRQRMRQSPLMDGPRFARNVEAAYRQMWSAWCAQA